MTDHWVRPSSVPIPSVWRLFSRVSKDGVAHRFRIQDATDDMTEPIIKHMTEHFIVDEPTCIATKCSDDEQSIKELVKAWREILKQRIVLVCVEELPNGELLKEDDGTTVIAGVNLTGAKLKTEPTKEEEIKGKAFWTMDGAMTYLNGLTDVFTRYNVQEVMTEFGLSVGPKYRRMGLATEIIKARVNLGKAVGLLAATTVFTGASSQALAEKCGYETIEEKTYEEIEKIHPEFTFPGIQTKSMKVMARRLDNEDDHY